MPVTESSLVSRVLAVLAKDLRLELRSRYALNAIIMFGVSAVAVISFSVGQSGLSPKLVAALFWVVMFFSAMAGLAHVFVREEESGTAMALRLAADPDSVYLGKLLFNLVLLTLLAAVIAPLYFILTEMPVAAQIGSFLLILVLGVVGLCAATTLVAAIIARTTVRGALFAVLSFPLLVPLLLVLVAATEKSLDGQGLGAGAAEWQFLIAFPIVTITASFLLFRYVWLD